MASAVLLSSIIVISIVVVHSFVNESSSHPLNSDRFYSDVNPRSKQYSSLLKATQRALNQPPKVNSKKAVAFRKIIRVVAVKTIEDVADAGFNRVRVITAATNCTLGRMSPRQKCNPLPDRANEDCKVSLQYNYFPHANFNPGPKANIQCLPLQL